MTSDKFCHSTVLIGSSMLTSRQASLLSSLSFFFLSLLFLSLSWAGSSFAGIRFLSEKSLKTISSSSESWSFLLGFTITNSPSIAGLGWEIRRNLASNFSILVFFESLILQLSGTSYLSFSSSLLIYSAVSRSALPLLRDFASSSSSPGSDRWDVVFLPLPLLLTDLLDLTSSPKLEWRATLVLFALPSIWSSYFDLNSSNV